MFILTRKRKDDTLIINDETKAELEQLCSQSSETFDNAQEDFLKKIFKPHSGRVPLYGKGVTPSNMKKGQKEVSDERLRDIAARETKVAEVEKKCEELTFGQTSMLKYMQQHCPQFQLSHDVMFVFRALGPSPSDVSQKDDGNRDSLAANA